MKTKRLVCLVALVGSLLLVGAGLALARPQGALTISCSAIGGGGGSATVGNTTLESLIGQWLASGIGGGATQLASGFLGGARLGGPNTITISGLTARGSRLGLSLGGLALIALGGVGLALAGRRARRRRHLESDL